MRNWSNRTAKFTKVKMRMIENHRASLSRRNSTEMKHYLNANSKSITSDSIDHAYFGEGDSFIHPRQQNHTLKLGGDCFNQHRRTGS